MPDTVAMKTDPRWGQADRDRKAEAILRTVELMAPECDVRRGMWLDIGCGSGGIAATLAHHVERVIGIDPECWERWDRFRTEHSNLQLHQGTFRDVDRLYGTNSIDVVVCNQVYEHVDDPIALIAAIHRVLKPGGMCYFAGPNLLWPIEPHVFWPFVHWLPRRFAQSLMRALGSKHAQELDAFAWTYWRLMRAFRRFGFEARSAIRDRLSAAVALRPNLPVRLAAAVPGVVLAALTPFAPGFVFVLRKPN